MGNSIKTKNVIITEEIDYKNLGNQLKYKPISKNIYLKIKQIEDTLEIYTFSNKKIFHGFKTDKNLYRIEGFSNSPNSRGEIIWDGLNITINMSTSSDILDSGEFKPNVSLKGHVIETNKDNNTINNEYEFKVIEEMDKTKIAILDKDIRYKPTISHSYFIKQLGEYILVSRAKEIIYVGRKQEKPLWFDNDYNDYFMLFTDNNGYLAIKLETRECILTIWGEETPIYKSERGLLVCG
jgi:hypothetical protein